MVIFTHNEKRRTKMSDSVYMPVRCFWGENAVEENSAALKELGKNKLNVTIGSALDLFGGNMEFAEVLNVINNENMNL